MRFVNPGIARFVFCAAIGSAIFFGEPSTANAQLIIGADAGDDENTLCVRNGVVGIAINDDCTKSEPLLLPSALRVGPTGSQTILDTATGAATFQATSTFSATANFNAGLTASSATVNGTSTLNGNVSVTSGHTVNFNGNKLEGVGDPDADTDAANKKYVDDQNNLQDLSIGNQQTQINSIVTVNNQQNVRLSNIEGVNAAQQIQINENTADILALQSNVQDLQQRDEELAEGIAVSMAIDAPLLRSGQTFAMRGGWGNFDGTHAAGVSAAGAISQNVVVDAGVGWGTSQGTVAGKAGVTIGW